MFNNSIVGNTTGTNTPERIIGIINGENYNDFKKETTNMKKLQVLIVIDMQNDFITGTLANKEAQKILPRVVELIKNFKGDIIFTRDSHEDDYLETNEGKHLPVKHCIEGTYGHQIHRDLLGWRDAIVIDKETFGSFELIKKIRNLYNLTGISVNGKEPCNELEIHIVGTLTEICVLTNVLLLKTAFPDFKIVVHKKCCAGGDWKSHNAALDIMKKCQIEIED